VDFGDPRRLGLATPTMPELVLLVKVQHFHDVVKVQGNHKPGGRSDFTKNQIRGHSIAFRHDAPMVTAITMSLNDITSKCETSITVELVGPNGEIDGLARNAKMQTCLATRSHVLFQHLSVLQSVHPSYQSDAKLQIYDFQMLKENLRKANEHLFDCAVCITSEDDILKEKYCGDDVSRIRSKILTDEEALELSKESASDECDSMQMSFAIVANRVNFFYRDTVAEESGLAQKHKLEEETLKRIKAIAEVLNIQLKEKACTNKTNAAQPKKHGSAEPTSSSHEPFQSLCEESPLNEFEEMEELLVGAFPTIFLFGRAYGNHNLLNPRQIQGFPFARM